MNTENIMQHLIGKTYSEVIELLTTDEDYGDCCGYSGCEVNDYVKELESAYSAILKDVIRIDYDDSDYSRVVVNFIFDVGNETGVILGYELTAGSGSGWSYGAWCTLKYGDEEIATASY